jgi:hypothetical protein
MIKSKRSLWRELLPFYPAGKSMLTADKPVRIKSNSSGENWVCKGKSWFLTKADGLSTEEKQLEIIHAALKHERKYSQIRRQAEAFAQFEKTESARRERIPDKVKMFVWQRDEGKCVRCGSKKRLEFDHIISVAEGGSSTERNIQLLCETCNRQKGKRV